MTAAPDPTALTEAGLSPEAAEAICAAGRPFEAPVGSELFRPGDLCPGFIALSEGVIRVSLLAENGRAATLYRVAPGQMCLQTFQHLIDGEPYSAEGVVETPVKGVMIPPVGFSRLMAESPPFRALVLAQVAERFDLIIKSFEETAFRPLEERLARGLLARTKDGVAEITHADLAAEIGSSREVVSRQMQRWAVGGLVRIARGRIEILAADALRDIARLTRA